MEIVILVDESIILIEASVSSLVANITHLSQSEFKSNGVASLRIISNHFIKLFLYDFTIPTHSYIIQKRGIGIQSARISNDYIHDII